MASAVDVRAARFGCALRFANSPPSPPQAEVLLHFEFNLHASTADRIRRSDTFGINNSALDMHRASDMFNPCETSKSKIKVGKTLRENVGVIQTDERRDAVGNA